MNSKPRNYLLSAPELLAAGLKNLLSAMGAAGKKGCVVVTDMDTIEIKSESATSFRILTLANSRVWLGGDPSLPASSDSSHGQSWR
jgi:hypothetical protein